MTQEQFEKAYEIDYILRKLGDIKNDIQKKKAHISLDGVLGEILLPYIEELIKEYQAKFDKL